MSVSMIEIQSTPTIRNHNLSHNSILRHVGMHQTQNRRKAQPRIRIEDLIANRPIGRIELLVLRRYPCRTVMSKGWTGSIAAACGRDETGLIGLVLWGDQVDRVRTGGYHPNSWWVVPLQPWSKGYFDWADGEFNHTGSMNTVFDDLRSTILRRSRSPAR